MPIVYVGEVIAPASKRYLNDPLTASSLWRNLPSLAVVISQFDGVGAGLIYDNHDIESASSCADEHRREN